MIQQLKRDYNCCENKYASHGTIWSLRIFFLFRKSMTQERRLMKNWPSRVKTVAYSSSNSGTQFGSLVSQWTRSMDELACSEIPPKTGSIFVTEVVLFCRARFSSAILIFYNGLNTNWGFCWNIWEWFCFPFVLLSDHYLEMFLRYWTDYRVIRRRKLHGNCSLILNPP